MSEKEWDAPRHVLFPFRVPLRNNHFHPDRFSRTDQNIIPKYTRPASMGCYELREFRHPVGILLAALEYLDHLTATQYSNCNVFLPGDTLVDQNTKFLSTYDAGKALF